MSPKFFSLFCFASPEIIWVKVCDRHSSYQTLRQTDCQILRYLIYIEINTKCKLISRLVLTNLILSWTILKTSNKYHDWSKSQPRCVAFLGPNFYDSIQGSFFFVNTFFPETVIPLQNQPCLMRTIDLVPCTRKNSNFPQISASQTKTEKV